MRFKNHYGFKAAFCNPQSGHEKGNVENKVGYHRRNLFVPPPRIDDLKAFNRKLPPVESKASHYDQLFLEGGGPYENYNCRVLQKTTAK
jgi:hypothetical protein